MDAMFFIVILSLAVTAMCQMDETQDRGDEKLYQACDTMMKSRFYPQDLGYEREDRAMLFSDLWALSIKASDGRGTDLAEDYLEHLFPYGDWGLTAEYGGKTECVNAPDGEWTQYAERSYRVEYGGELTVTLFRR